MEGLTDRQKEILAFIVRYLKKAGFPPTSSEIASEFGFNLTAAVQHVRVLEQKGFVKRTPSVARGIRVL
jgi:repressor LexA